MNDVPREELRIALVMNGGVSLAVWMGGVTNEIFRVVRERHPVYEELLGMTCTAAKVDVISGTSAGGINGAALATALLYDGEFSLLRDVWLEAGSFQDLLRSPIGENPGSLLKGDEYFLPALKAALVSLAHSPTALAPDAVPLDLRLTTTLLEGRPGRSVDDLGVDVNDADYRAYFHFCNLPDRCDFAERAAVIDAMARAARSTASFPVAFEPSHVQGQHLQYLKDSRDRDISTPQYVIDGGVLDNKLFRGAREAIFKMARLGSVRRVLAYINPDPSGVKPADNPGDRGPSLAAVLSESVLGIPQSQSIADQLRAIDDHNDAVRSRRNNVWAMAVGLDVAALRDLAGRLFGVYRDRRLSSTFELFVYKPLVHAAERHPGHAAGLRMVGLRGRDQLKTLFKSIGWRMWIPFEWPDAAEHAFNAPDDWRWGLFPVEFAAGVMLDLLRRTQSLWDYLPQSQEPAAGAAPRAPAPPSAAQRGPLEAEWADAYRIVDRLTQMRSGERPTWETATDALLVTLDLAVKHEADRPDFIARFGCAHLRQMFFFINGDRRRADCAALAYDIAQLIRRTCPRAQSLALALTDNQRVRPADRELVRGLQALAKLLAPADGTAGDTLYTLLQLEVIEYAFDDHESLSTDTVIELAQISGNSKSPLSMREKANEKLLGLQLGHFGAFYKKSWRANDWIFGRLDGAERLVKILLNPERLYRLYYQRRPAALKMIKDIAVGRDAAHVLTPTLAKLWTVKVEGAIDGELVFLDDAKYKLPDFLPACAAAVTTRLHYSILHEELPTLQDAIAWDQAMGAEPAGPGASLLISLRGLPFSPDKAQAQLAAGLIARETFLRETGSDLFTRTVTHAFATLRGALVGRNAKLGAVSSVMAFLKLPILGFYLVAQGITRQSKTAATLNGGVLAVGAALVALQFAWTPEEFGKAGPPAIIAKLGWALLAGGLLLSVLRGQVMILTLLVTGLCVAAWQANYHAMAAILGVLVLLIGGIWSAWLRWFAGVATLVLAAAWGSGSLAGARQPDRAVWVFAGAVGAALLIAVAQTWNWPKRLRHALIDRWEKKKARGKSSA